MKNYILIIITFLTFSNLYAQHHKSNNKSAKETPTWFFLDLQGGFGVDEYLNTNINNDENTQISYVNPAYHYSAKIGVNFGFGAGLAFEIGNSSYSQTYDLKSNIDGSNFTNTSTVNAMQKTILLRRDILGSYIEAGPQFLNIKSGNNYSNFTNIVLGFGGPLVYKNSFDINLGLRLTYSLSDVMQNNSYPNQSLKYIPIYSSYTPTSIISAQLTLGVNWHIGYFSRAKCDKHVEFLFM